jgi:hypothetical protein
MSGASAPLAVDAWTAAAAITNGSGYQAIDRAGRAFAFRESSRTDAVVAALKVPYRHVEG